MGGGGRRRRGERGAACEALKAFDAAPGVQAMIDECEFKGKPRIVGGGGSELAAATAAAARQAREERRSGGDDGSGVYVRGAGAKVEV